MIDKPAHLCLTCNLAKWNLIDTTTGKCTWKLPHVPLPAVMAWDLDGNRNLWPFKQHIRIDRPITECETYKATS